MAANESSAGLARTATDKDLERISRLVGSNWEMLGPYLLKESPMVRVEQIKEDHHGTAKRIFYLLLAWRNEAAPDTTLGHLFHQMFKVGTSVTVEWRTIAKHLGIDERDIRACKTGYQLPIQVPATNPSIADTDIQYSTQQLPVQVTEERMEVDSGPVPEKGKQAGDFGRVSENEKMEVDMEHGTEEVGELSLADKRRNKTCRAPKDACIFDGRLIKLEKKDISSLESVCVKEIGTGGFGSVYSSSDYLAAFPKGFGMHVAVKKIKVRNTKDEDRIRSIRREMITSRIMHPFVLPLLAVADRLRGNSEFWFVSPLCKNGDLHEAIQRNLILKEKTFVKILLHIALAIKYIHTAVVDVRDVILHKDISSRNVVLDDNFNARLIDFGLAREKDDGTTDEKGKLCYLHYEFGKGPATESWDYYSLGVLIREMLTGLEPQGHGSRFLKCMEAGEIMDKLKKCVWKTSERAEKVNSISKKCLNQNHWKVGDFNEEVVQGITEIWKGFGEGKLLQVGKDDAKCHICMINPKAEETSFKQDHKPNCTQKIEACIACEKNSFLNPVTCYCGIELQPEIGSKYGALLVAGNDLKNPLVAEALKKDILKVKKLITSRAPRIMGISENKVHEVVPRKPGKLEHGEEPEDLWPKVKKCFDIFSEDKEIGTLLIYFSCHGAKDNGSGDAENNWFELGSESERISMTTFQNELDRLQQIEKLVIVLDRCHPLNIKFQGSRKFFQINSCDENEKADITDEGSIFTKYLVQGLKAKSERMKTCDDCHWCYEFWAKRTDFITAESLYEYVKNHMKKVSPTKAMNWKGDSNIAFYTDEQVFIEFEDCISKGKKGVPLEYLQRIEELKSELVKIFGKDEKDQVRILRDTYRKKNATEECDTLEKVMSAWVHRQPLKVKFERNGSDTNRQ